MDLESVRQHQASSLHWTKVSAMVCFFIAGAVLASSLLPMSSERLPAQTAAATDLRH